MHCLLLVALERIRSDFACDCLKLFYKGRRSTELEDFLDFVKLLFDMVIVVASDEYHTMQDVRLCEWLLPIRLARAWFDRIANDTGTGYRAHRVSLHTILEVLVVWSAEVFGKDPGHLWDCQSEVQNTLYLDALPLEDPSMRTQYWLQSSRQAIHLWS